MGWDYHATLELNLNYLICDIKDSILPSTQTDICLQIKTARESLPTMYGRLKTSVIQEAEFRDKASRMGPNGWSDEGDRSWVWRDGSYSTVQTTHEKTISGHEFDRTVVQRQDPNGSLTYDFESKNNYGGVGRIENSPLKLSAVIGYYINGHTADELVNSLKEFKVESSAPNLVVVSGMDGTHRTSISLRPDHSWMIEKWIVDLGKDIALSKIDKFQRIQNQWIAEEARFGVVKGHSEDGVPIRVVNLTISNVSPGIAPFEIPPIRQRTYVSDNINTYVSNADGSLTLRSRKGQYAEPPLDISWIFILSSSALVFVSGLLVIKQRRRQSRSSSSRKA